MGFLKGIGCNTASYFGSKLALSGLAKDYLGPVVMYRDLDNIDDYLERSEFLPYLNNEVKHKNADKYRNRILSLNSATFIKWDYDTVVYPRGS